MAAPDLSLLIPQINFTNVTVAVIFVGAGLLSVALAEKSAKAVLKVIKPNSSEAIDNSFAHYDEDGFLISDGGSELDDFYADQDASDLMYAAVEDVPDEWHELRLVDVEAEISAMDREPGYMEAHGIHAEYDYADYHRHELESNLKKIEAFDLDHRFDPEDVPF